MPAVASAFTSIPRSAAIVRSATGSSLRAPTAIESVGVLVPRQRFDARVHSVFDRACNWAVGDLLLTLVDAGLGRGPTTLRLPASAPCRPGRMFACGEHIVCRDGVVRGARIQLLLGPAATWCDPAVATRVGGERLEARLALAAAVLARWRRTADHRLPRGFDDIVAALETACLHLDVVLARHCTSRLIGWGEGLTPSGDDVLVGLLAALGALERGNHGRERLRTALAACVAAQAARTTALSGQLLRQAAAGLCSETLSTLRDALLAAPSDVGFDRALDTALAVGATSGADVVTGFLAGVRAWGDCCGGDRGH